MAPQYIVVGYIGEKNSRLQLYLVDPADPLVHGSPAPGELKHDQTFKNHEYGTFIQVSCDVFCDSALCTTGCTYSNRRAEKIGWAVSVEGLRSRYLATR